MLDRKNEAILRYLNSKIGGNFTVVTKGEILSGLPEKLHVSSQDFASAVNYFKQNEYVEVKYEDDKEICLAVTGKAVALLEHKKNDVERAELTKKQHVLVFLFAFLGALIGSLAALAIFKLALGL